MKRLVITAIVKMCGKAVLLVVAAAVAIVIMGNLNKWDTSRVYSDAFFIAGCLLIVGGTASRLAAGQQWNNFQQLHAESLSDLSGPEQALFIINTNSPVGTAILGLLSGAVLILIAVFVSKI